MFAGFAFLGIDEEEVGGLQDGIKDEGHGGVGRENSFLDR
jgi:hypothetical protein